MELGVQTDWAASVTGLGVQTDWATSVGPDVQTDWLGMIFTPGVQTDRARDEVGRRPREEMTVEVPNITNVIEVSKLYRGPEMKSIGV